MVKMIKVSDETHQKLKEVAEASGFSLREVADAMVTQGEDMKQQVEEATKKITDLVRAVEDTHGLTSKPGNPRVPKPVTKPVTYEETDLDTDAGDEESSPFPWGWAILIGIGLLYLRARRAGETEPSWDALRGLGIM